MTYSCALWEEGDTLEQAQERKLRAICEKLRLRTGDHVLEIGCGWGSFALMAAGEYGARVTGVTLSQQQLELARERVAAAGPRRPHRDPPPGLPHARGAVLEDRFDRDARGDRLRAVPDLLRRLRPAARPRRPRRDPSDRDARPALRALPAQGGLDPALHLPRLAPAVARGAADGDEPRVEPDGASGSRRSARTTRTR